MAKGIVRLPLPVCLGIPGERKFWRYAPLHARNPGKSNDDYRGSSGEDCIDGVKPAELWMSRDIEDRGLPEEGSDGTGWTQEEVDGIFPINGINLEQLRCAQQEDTELVTVAA